MQDKASQPLIETLPMTLGVPYADDPSTPLNIEIPLQVALPDGQTLYAAVALGGLPFHGQRQIAERITAAWNAFAGVATGNISAPGQCLHQIQESKDLPHGKRLSSFYDLIGHTIMHVFEDEDCIDNQMVIVTETRCHLAVNAQHGACEEDDPRIVTTSVWGDDSKFTIEKYIKAETLRRHGLLGAEAAAAQKRADELKRIRYLKQSAQESRSRAADNIRWAERDEAKAAELEAEIEQRAQAQKGQP